MKIETLLRLHKAIRDLVIKHTFHQLNEIWLSKSAESKKTKFAALEDVSSTKKKKTPHESTAGPVAFHLTFLDIFLWITVFLPNNHLAAFGLNIAEKFSD